MYITIYLRHIHCICYMPYIYTNTCLSYISYIHIYTYVQLQVADSELTQDLTTNLETLRTFHATRKLRGAVKAVIALNRMKSGSPRPSGKGEGEGSGSANGSNSNVSNTNNESPRDEQHTDDGGDDDDWITAQSKAK